MKKLLMALVAGLIPVAMFSQAQINTKKAEIEDFTEKVTKVVLTGDIFLDSQLEKAVKDCWRISPYEFCNMDEFNALKGDSDYYFLIPVSAQYRKEVAPGIMMLTLLKGGKGSDKSIDKMFEVVSAPLCPTEDPSGREMTFLPALVDIIQTQAAASMEKEIAAYSGLKSSPRGEGPVEIVFAESDVNFKLGDVNIPEDKAVSILSDDEADALVEDGAENTVVSYCVYPSDARPNSYCYNFLIDAKTHKLYYYRKYKITKKSGVGFLKEDLTKILK